VLEDETSVVLLSRIHRRYSLISQLEKEKALVPAEADLSFA
jgi:hypothetical protein